MVTAATSFGRNGLSDWLLQRFSAIILAAYTFFIVGYLVLNPELSYTEWHGLFSQLWVKIFTLLAIISIVAHGWIGIWVVLTDYVTARMMGGKALPIRILILSTYAVINVVFVIWGVDILWGLH